MSRTPRKALRLPVILTLAVALAAGCSGSGKKSTASPSPTAVSPTPTPSPTATPVSVPLNPLTGTPVGVNNQVLAVKIDNTKPAFPQQGVESADVVYLEEVEGGLTRLCAVFSSTIPGRLGPVRSVRETDIELLAPYGRIAFAFSGGNKGVLPKVHNSPLIDVSVDRVTSKYYRVFGGRHAPYNLFTNPRGLLAAKPTSARVHDIGFHFGTASTPGTPARGFSVAFLRARATWAWSVAEGRWLLTMNGRADTVVGGSQLGADNVIVQFVTIERSRFSDVNGVSSPITRTVGSGRTMYFRDGTVTAGTWSRSGAKPTVFKDANGKVFVLKPGKTWVVLVRKGTNVPVS